MPLTRVVCVSSVAPSETVAMSPMRTGPGATTTCARSSGRENRPVTSSSNCLGPWVMLPPGIEAFAPARAFCTWARLRP